MRFFSKGLLIALCLMVSACGVVNGPTTNSNGPQSLDAQQSLIAFDATSSQQQFRAIPMTNNFSDRITLVRVEFKNNLCAAFSLSNISDFTGRQVADPFSAFAVNLGPGKMVNLTVRFNPAACVYTNYSSTMVVFYKDSTGHQQHVDIALKSEGSPPAAADGTVENTGDCPAPVDESQLSREYFSKIPPAGSYYLRVDRLRAYIFPVEAPAGQDQVVGSDVGGLRQEDFDTPFLPMTISNATATASDFSVNQITPCDQFNLPTHRTDVNFFGQDVLLTSVGPLEGTFTRDISNPRKRTVNVEVHDAGLTLFAENIPDGNVKDTDGRFRISLRIDLTTESTAPDSILVANLEGNKNFHKDNPEFERTEEVDGKRGLLGTPFVDGRMVLVGKGQFIRGFTEAEPTFIGNEGLAGQYLLEAEAFLYVRLEVTLMKSMGTEGVPQ